MPSAAAASLSPPVVPALTLPGFRTPVWVRALDQRGHRETNTVDLAQGIDGVFIQVDSNQAPAFLQELEASLNAQRHLMGVGAVLLVHWERDGRSVVAVLETSHANVGLMVLESLAVRHGLIPDSYVIGVAADPFRMLASEEVQSVVLAQ